MRKTTSRLTSPGWRNCRRKSASPSQHSTQEKRRASTGLRDPTHEKASSTSRSKSLAPSQPGTTPTFPLPNSKPTRTKQASARKFGRSPCKPPPARADASNNSKKCTSTNLPTPKAPFHTPRSTKISSPNEMLFIFLTYPSLEIFTQYIPLSFRAYNHK